MCAMVLPWWGSHTWGFTSHHGLLVEKAHLSTVPQEAPGFYEDVGCCYDMSVTFIYLLIFS